MFKADGCYHNDVPFCRDLGFDMITIPGPVGATDFDSVRQLLFIYNDIIYNETLSGALQVLGQCRQSWSELLCGIRTPMCSNGETIPVCKESCEGEFKLRSG